ncbi:hypothetical protein E3N88_38163 [Mikania micrantha]|uniref:Uncharacterized protein n=1 Tax=Mikania micrantha TaxID=192012 RepID=A0A5N6LT83_9ASTR|nr:hypothetical protein E3N88_38163 [Mikania micrantha]
MLKIIKGMKRDSKPDVIEPPPVPNCPPDVTAMARTIAPQTNVIEVTPLLKDVPEALQNTGAIDGDPDEDDMQLCT